jgi:uncharacterized membrane protein YgcG
MTFLRRFFLTLFACLLLSTAAVAKNHERITEFRSDVVVRPDGALDVTETIKVVARGKEIKRGILRDFPTTYEGRYGQTIRVGFKVIEVRRDGRPEPFKTESVSNGVRVRIGDKDVFISRGEHVYTIVYRTTRQLGFFAEFDELYWNVTGSGWSFEIERALATVTLPQGAEVLNWAAYTGRPGERGQDFASAYSPSAAMALETTRTLKPGEGFTIAVAFPKGFVVQPSASEEAAFVLDDNAAFAVGIAGLAVLLLYFLLVWVRVGRDPEKGTIVPEYEPPDGFSPAAARYVAEMGYDAKSFTAAVVNLAVKGYLVIEEYDEGEYTLKKTGDESGLSPGEATLARKLFPGGVMETVLEQSNHKRLSKAQKALRKSLKDDFEKAYFLRNTWYFVPGVLITLVTAAIMAALGPDPAAAGFMTLWLSIWSLGCYGLALKVASSWRAVQTTGSLLQTGGAIYITLFSLPFFGGLLFGLWFLAESLSLPATLALCAILLVDIGFYDLLKAPTRLGRRVMDRIEGFKLYLSVAEKDRMNFHNPPERTPELFEKFLPYALALGVEQAWSEQFDGVLARASQGPGGGNGYRPHWYSGNHFHGHRLGDFASNLGSSFSGAIASASGAPGSSGGSGGGGSSGGGGGGGGGSGW